jgi:hypothetical protein
MIFWFGTVGSEVQILSRFKGGPPSSCFSAPMICASVCRLLDILLPPS